MINETIDPKEVATTFNRANWHTGYTVLDALAQHDWVLIAMNHPRPGLTMSSGKPASWTSGVFAAVKGQALIDVREFDQLPEFAAILNGSGATMSWLINADCTLLEIRVGGISSEYKDYAYFRVTPDQVNAMAERINFDVAAKIKFEADRRAEWAARSW